MSQNRREPSISEDRDPYHINEHLLITFSDVIAEQKEPRSFDIVWDFSIICFECWKNGCYGFITLLCGCWIAGAWGIIFAYTVAVPHIWFITPVTRLCKLCSAHLFQQCSTYILRCLILPCTRACGKFFHVFQVDIIEQEPEITTRPVAMTVPSPVRRTPLPSTPEKEDTFDDLFLGEPVNMTKTIQRSLDLYMNKPTAEQNKQAETDFIPFE